MCFVAVLEAEGFFPGGCVVKKSTGQREITVKRLAGSLPEARVFLREVLKQSALPEYQRGLVALAVDEVVSAVVESTAPASAGTIRLAVDVSDVAVRIEIEDSENSFGNGLTDENTLAQARDNNQRREIAVYFICEIMDEIYYTYQKGFENRLVMVKFIK